MMAPLSPRQRDVLRHIQAAIEAQGYPPTVREIAALLGVRSPNAVHQHLRVLERKGYVERAHSASRALAVRNPRPPRNTIPFLGKIS